MNSNSKSLEVGTEAVLMQTLKPINISKGETAEGPLVVQSDTTWVLNLVNMTNECFAWVQVTDSTGAWGKWYRMTPACRTCSLGSFDACKAAAAYVAILVSQCTAHAFSISIATEPDANGNSNGATWQGITPNCQYAGAVIGIH